MRTVTFYFFKENYVTSFLKFNLDYYNFVNDDCVILDFIR